MGTFNQDKSIFYSGYSSGRIVVGYRTQESYYVSNLFQVNQTTKYNFGAFIKTQNLQINDSTREGVLVKIFWYSDTAGTSTSGISASDSVIMKIYTDATMGWTKKDIFAISPVNAKSATVYLGLNAPGTVWFDQVNFGKGKALFIGTAPVIAGNSIAGSIKLVDNFGNVITDDTTTQFYVKIVSETVNDSTAKFDNGLRAKLLTFSAGYASFSVTDTQPEKVLIGMEDTGSTGWDFSDTTSVKFVVKFEFDVADSVALTNQTARVYVTSKNVSGEVIVVNDTISFQIIVTNSATYGEDSILKEYYTTNLKYKNVWFKPNLLMTFGPGDTQQRIDIVDSKTENVILTFSDYDSTANSFGSSATVKFDRTSTQRYLRVTTVRSYAYYNNLTTPTRTFYFFVIICDSAGNQITEGDSDTITVTLYDGGAFVNSATFDTRPPDPDAQRVKTWYTVGGKAEFSCFDFEAETVTIRITSSMRGYDTTFFSPGVASSQEASSKRYVKLYPVTNRSAYIGKKLDSEKGGTNQIVFETVDDSGYWVYSDTNSQYTIKVTEANVNGSVFINDSKVDSLLVTSTSNGRVYIKITDTEAETATISVINQQAPLTGGDSVLIDFRGANKAVFKTIYDKFASASYFTDASFANYYYSRTTNDIYTDATYRSSYYTVYRGYFYANYSETYTFYAGHASAGGTKIYLNNQLCVSSAAGTDATGVKYLPKGLHSFRMEITPTGGYFYAGYKSDHIPKKYLYGYDLMSHFSSAIYSSAGVVLQMKNMYLNDENDITLNDSTPLRIYIKSESNGNNSAKIYRADSSVSDGDTYININHEYGLIGINVYDTEAEEVTLAIVNLSAKSVVSNSEVTVEFKPPKSIRIYPLPSSLGNNVYRYNSPYNEKMGVTVEVVDEDGNVFLNDNVTQYKLQITKQTGKYDNSCAIEGGSPTQYEITDTVYNGQKTVYVTDIENEFVSVSLVSVNSQLECDSNVAIGIFVGTTATKIAFTKSSYSGYAGTPIEITVEARDANDSYVATTDIESSDSFAPRVSFYTTNDYGRFYYRSDLSDTLTFLNQIYDTKLTDGRLTVFYYDEEANDPDPSIWIVIRSDVVPLTAPDTFQITINPWNASKIGVVSVLIGEVGHPIHVAMQAQDKFGNLVTNVSPSVTLYSYSATGKFYTDSSLTVILTDTTLLNGQENVYYTDSADTLCNIKISDKETDIRYKLEDFIGGVKTSDITPPVIVLTSPIDYRTTTTIENFPFSGATEKDAILVVSLSTQGLASKSYTLDVSSSDGKFSSEVPIKGLVDDKKYEVRAAVRATDPYGNYKEIIRYVQFATKITVDEGGKVEYGDGMSLEIEPKSIDRDTLILVDKLPVDSSKFADGKNNDMINGDYTKPVNVYDIYAVNDYGKRYTLIFKKPAKLTLPYPDENKNGIVDVSETMEHKIDEKSLRIYYWDSVLWSFMGGNVNEENMVKNRVSVNIKHLSIYGLFEASKFALEETNDLVLNYIASSTFTPTLTENEKNSSVKFAIKHPKYKKVKVTVFDVTGEPVVELTDEDPLGTGVAEIVWDGKSKYNVLVESGIYIYQIQSENVNRVISGTIVLAR